MRQVAVALCSTLMAAKAVAQNAPSNTPIFEPFDYLDKQQWYVSDGWSNGAHQNCIWSSGAVDMSHKGFATLKHEPDGSAYSCAEIQTKAFFKYGTFEARIRADAGSGRNAAFFAFAGTTHKQPHQEIDVEILTKAPTDVWLNRYYDGDDFGEGGVVTSGAPTSEFHHYAFIWKPDRLLWYIDGALMREETKNIPNLPLKIYFSHWSSDTFTKWMGPFEPSPQMHSMEIDWFSYTPFAMPCQFPESILCSLE